MQPLLAILSNNACGVVGYSRARAWLSICGLQVEEPEWSMVSAVFEDVMLSCQVTNPTRRWFHQLARKEGLGPMVTVAGNRYLCENGARSSRSSILTHSPTVPWASPASAGQPELSVPCFASQCRPAQAQYTLGPVRFVVLQIVFIPEFFQSFARFMPELCQSYAGTMPELCQNYARSYCHLSSER